MAGRRFVYWILFLVLGAASTARGEEGPRVFEVADEDLAASTSPAPVPLTEGSSGQVLLPPTTAPAAALEITISTPAAAPGSLPADSTEQVRPESEAVKSTPTTRSAGRTWAREPAPRRVGSPTGCARAAGSRSRCPRGRDSWLARSTSTANPTPATRTERASVQSCAPCQVAAISGVIKGLST
jgi:hypothetical protein